MIERCFHDRLGDKVKNDRLLKQYRSAKKRKKKLTIFWFFSKKRI